MSAKTCFGPSTKIGRPSMHLYSSREHQATAFKSYTLGSCAVKMCHENSLSSGSPCWGRLSSVGNNWNKMFKIWKRKGKIPLNVLCSGSSMGANVVRINLAGILWHHSSPLRRSLSISVYIYIYILYIYILYIYVYPTHTHIWRWRKTK